MKSLTFSQRLEIIDMTMVRLCPNHLGQIHSKKMINELTTRWINFLKKEEIIAKGKVRLKMKSKKFTQGLRASFLK